MAFLLIYQETHRFVFDVLEVLKLQGLRWVYAVGRYFCEILGTKIDEPVMVRLQEVWRLLMRNKSRKETESTN
jgi:hypothetical protein